MRYRSLTAAISAALMLVPTISSACEGQEHYSNNAGWSSNWSQPDQSGYAWGSQPQSGWHGATYDSNGYGYVNAHEWNNAQGWGNAQAWHDPSGHHAANASVRGKANVRGGGAYQTSASGGTRVKYASNRARQSANQAYDYGNAQWNQAYNYGQGQMQDAYGNMRHYGNNVDAYGNYGAGFEANGNYGNYGTSQGGWMGGSFGF